MFHDLDVAVPPNVRGAARETLERLGYDVAAFTTVISDVNKLTDEHLPPQHEIGKGSSAPSVFHTDPSKRHTRLTVLQRATLVVDDAAQLPLLNSPVLNKYDVVAVRPATEKLLQQCLQFDFDIISLALDRRQLFHVKRPQVHVAAEKGMLFEISYAHGLRDTNTRRQLIANACSLARATGGKHILMSSGARTVMELRGPHDVINLGILFDVPQQHSHDAVTRNAASVVAHGDVRTHVHKGVVRVEKVAYEETTGGGDKMDI